MKKSVKFQDSNELWLCDDPKDFDELSAKGLPVIPVAGAVYKLSDFPFTQYALEGNSEDYDEEYLYRILLRILGRPWTILETERLLVRETTVEDVDRFYEIYSQPGITDFIENLFENPEDEKIYTRNYIKDIYGYYNYGIWTVIEKQSNRIIGRAGISPEDGCEYPDLGFVIDKEYQGHGYAFEVCAAIMDYAKNELEFNTIQARVKPNNLISVSLLKKLGFKINRKPHQGYLTALHTYA